MTETDTATIDDVPQAQLAKHAMRQAYEAPSEYVYDGVDSNVDNWSLYDAHNHIVHVDSVISDSLRRGPFTEIDTDESLWGLVVGAELTGTVSERVSRATRWNPAEYRNHDVPIFVEAAWFPRPDQLAPFTALHIEQAGDPLGTPDPEPYDDRL